MRTATVVENQEPVSSRRAEEVGLLDRLERQGLLRRGLGGLAKEILEPPPKPPLGMSILKALLDDRGEGR